MGDIDKTKEQLIKELTEIRQRITELERSEQQLRESEERYRTLLETAYIAGEGIVILQNTEDKEGAVVFMNDTVARIGGYTKEELLGRSFVDVIHPDSLSIMAERYRQRQRGKETPGRYEVKLLGKDGTVIPVAVSAGITTYQGKVATILFTEDDINRMNSRGTQDQTGCGQQGRRLAHRNQAEDNLAALCNILRSMTESLDLGDLLKRIVSQVGAALDSAYTGIVILNEDGSLEVVSEDFAGIPPPSIMVRLHGFAERIVASGEPVVVGDVDASQSTAPAIAVAGIKSYAGVPIKFKDATLGILFVHSTQRDGFGDRVELLQAFATQAAIAIGNDRLYKETGTAGASPEPGRLKTELLADISHELRTPLASIKGYCTAILTHYERLTDEEKIDFLHEVDQASDRLTELIGQVLQLSKFEAGGLPVEKKPIEIVPVIKDAVKDMKQKAGKYRFVTHLAEPLPVVQADPGCIRQVLGNLLSNAVKFSSEDTEISVKCESNEQELIVSVQDQGIGISPREIDKVFDRFYQAASGLYQKPVGAGLGLTICKHMVEAHGGRIWVESIQWEGSTFYFTIPIQTRSEGHSHSEEDSDKDCFGRGGRRRRAQVRRPGAGTRRLPRASG